jgi:glycosyltransferase involved in cell wall biosynthesis
MDLIVNSVGSRRSSWGARRYYEGIVSRLRWPGKIEIPPLPKHRRLERPYELMQRGRRDAIFWSPSHRGPLFAHHHVITVLDCLNVEYTYRNDWRLPIFRRLFNAVLNNAEAVIAISHATRDAVLRNYDVDPGKVVAIPGPIDFSSGVDTMISDESAPTRVVAQDHPEGPFVLMITNPLSHKNTVAAGKAFAASGAARAGVTLRVVGALAEEGSRACRTSGVNIEECKGVADSTLARWMKDCEFLFAASLDEGLDLPVGEALSRGANVLCSDIPVHREFYEGRVLWFDPHSHDSMVTAIDDALMRQDPWQLSGCAKPISTFDDVAGEYRALFMRIAGKSSAAFA